TPPASSYPACSSHRRPRSTSRASPPTCASWPRSTSSDTRRRPPRASTGLPASFSGSRRAIASEFAQPRPKVPSRGLRLGRLRGAERRECRHLLQERGKPPNARHHTGAPARGGADDARSADDRQRRDHPRARGARPCARPLVRRGRDQRRDDRDGRAGSGRGALRRRGPGRAGDRAARQDHPDPRHPGLLDRRGEPARQHVPGARHRALPGSPPLRGGREPEGRARLAQRHQRRPARGRGPRDPAGQGLGDRPAPGRGLEQGRGGPRRDAGHALDPRPRGPALRPRARHRGRRFLTPPAPLNQPGEPRPMSMSNDELQQLLLATFADQAREQLQTINQRLLALEKAGDGERGPLLEEIFREAHSLKGASRAVSLDKVEAVAHRLESLFSVIQNGSIEPDAKIFDVAYQALDAITALVEEGLTGAENDVDVEAVCAVLAAAAEPTDATPAAAADEAPAEEPTAAPTPDTPHPTRDTPHPTPEAKPKPARKKADAPVDETVRVATSKLDALMAQVGELLAARIGADHRSAEVRS